MWSINIIIIIVIIVIVIIIIITMIEESLVYHATQNALTVTHKQLEPLQIKYWTQDAVKYWMQDAGNMYLPINISFAFSFICFLHVFMDCIC